MDNSRSFYSISWKSKDGNTHSVFVPSRTFAIYMFLSVRKTNKTAELVWFPEQCEISITIFGGRK